MESKIIFIDIDGTLTGSLNGKQVIPESAKRAIKNARKNGHLVYLSTGRSKAEIHQEILDIGFDGIIGGAGVYVEVNDRVVFHQTISKESILDLKKYFINHDIHYLLETNEGIYCDKKAGTYIVEKIYHGNMEGDTDYFSILRDIDGFTYENVNKISFFSEGLKYIDIYNALKEKFDIVEPSWPHDDIIGGEIMQKGINKATAILYLMKYLNLDIRNSIAFGDSMNDIEMFQCVHTAIAMGNASDEIIKYAGFVTKDIFEDGIEYGMKYYNLI